jgi:hypothetical protein
MWSKQAWGTLSAHLSLGETFDKSAHGQTLEEKEKT